MRVNWPWTAMVFDGPGVNSLSKPKRWEMHIASMELNSWSSPSHLDGKKKH